MLALALNLKVGQADGLQLRCGLPGIVGRANGADHGQPFSARLQNGQGIACVDAPNGHQRQ
jgi:hypothetical protein